LTNSLSDILSDNNPNNDESACGKLGAFINQVNAAERRDRLIAQQADDLSPLRYLLIPNGVAHRLDGLEKVFTINRPVVFVNEEQDY
jgi:hypothetical protein